MTGAAAASPGADALSRRTLFQSAGAVALGLGVRGTMATAAPDGTMPGGSAATRSRISPSDLVIDGPSPASEDGLPIGNGRMGSLVWTVPSGLRLQINRVDLYPAASTSNSFNEPHKDYCGGCAFVDIDFEGQPFAGTGLRQRLSVYDGVATIETADLVLCIVPDRARDAFAIQIDDLRPVLRSVTARLRALRFDPASLGAAPGSSPLPGVSTVRTKAHDAISRLRLESDRIILSQEFREDPYLARSAVALGTDGDVAGVDRPDDAQAALRLAGRRRTTIFVGSAVCRDGDDAAIGAQAGAIMAAARSAGFASVARDTAAWWHAFWEQGSVALASPDGTAQRLQRDYHYFLYLMASTSGGAVPPKFNGMLWSTGGDPRAWGAQHWYTNLSCYYEALPAAGRLELMEPLFAMYSAMLPSCERAAREQWGSRGHFIPETVYADGVAPLPDAIAAEMRDLYAGRKDWVARSADFRAYAEPRHPYAAAWNWKGSGHWVQGHYVTGERGQGCYGPVSHIFAANAKIAWLFWQRYEYDLDEAWLRTRAYPMLRGVVDFYRHHPLVAREADGKIHIRGANNSEPVRGARDTNEDLSAMRAVTAALIRASEILAVGESERAEWARFRDDLADLPLSDDPDALATGERGRPVTFAAARKPAVYANPAYPGPDPHSLPTWFFGLCGLHASDARLKAVADATLERLLRDYGPDTALWNNGLTKLPIAAAMAGRADLVRTLVPRQMGAVAKAAGAPAHAPLRANRMSLGEGPQALSAEHLGRASQALQLALLQSDPPAPGEAPILHLCPAWPPEWSADFTLAARGGFAIEASVRDGRIEAVSIRSRAGARCTLRNPFAGPARLIRDGAAAETIADALLRFATKPGETVALAPAAPATRSL